MTNSLSNLSQLHGYNFYWNSVLNKDTARLNTGLIAQEVKKVFPELITVNDNGYLSVNYVELIPHLIESVKELDSKNNKLARENQLLKSELQGFKEATNEKLKQLEARMQSIEMSSNLANEDD